jgi:hypothetical protein
MVVFLAVGMPSLARAEPQPIERAHASVLSLALEQARPGGGQHPIATFLAGLAVLAASAGTSSVGLARRAPPVSLVAIAWPTGAAAPTSPHGHRLRPATWTVPDGGAKPMFFATLLDLRF